MQSNINSSKEEFRSEEYYSKKLELVAPVIIEELAKGKHVEVSPSRSGIKVSVNDRRYIKIKGIRDFNREEFNPASQNAICESRD